MSVLLCRDTYWSKCASKLVLQVPVQTSCASSSNSDRARQLAAWLTERTDSGQLQLAAVSTIVHVYNFLHNAPLNVSAYDSICFIVCCFVRGVWVPSLYNLHQIINEDEEGVCLQQARINDDCWDSTFPQFQIFTFILWKCCAYGLVS